MILHLKQSTVNWLHDEFNTGRFPDGLTMRDISINAPDSGVIRDLAIRSDRDKPTPPVPSADDLAPYSLAITNAQTTRQSKEDVENSDIDAFLALGDDIDSTNPAHFLLLAKVLRSYVNRR